MGWWERREGMGCLVTTAREDVCLLRSILEGLRY